MAIELNLRSYRTTENLEKVVLETTAEDFQMALRYIAAFAIEEQINSNNPPTSILIDGRANGTIATAKRRVQVFFGNVDDLRRAVIETWSHIQSLTRVASGRAMASYQLWYKETPIGNNPNAVSGYLDRFNPATDYFRIVGPVLVYGRKVYWNPKGTPKFTKRVIFRGRDTTGPFTIKAVRIRGIMNLVEQSMRRKYRGLAIAEDWVVTSSLPKDGRTPGIWIGFKRKGTLLNKSGRNYG